MRDEREDNPTLKKLDEVITKLALETGHSYDVVLMCAVEMCDKMLREANLHAD